jgi:hypothetical protein
MWGLGQDTLLGIVVGLCGDTGNTLLGIGLRSSGNTLFGIDVGLCGASGKTLYWVLLLVYAS